VGSRTRRVAAGVAIAVASGVGALAAGGAAHAQPSLPSNCFWTSTGSYWGWFPEQAAGIAGYCVGPGGSYEWFGWDGSYGDAWWM
jgi:hypothetical protein